jgi:hypothetical protein
MLKRLPARLLAAAAIGVLAHSGALAGAWTPALEFGLRVDQDRRETDARQDSVLGFISPKLGLDSGTSISRLQVSVEGLFGYSLEPATPGSEPRSRSLDLVSNHTSLRAGTSWSKLDSLYVGGQHLISHDPIDLGLGAWSARTLEDIREWDAWGRGSLRRMEGAYRIDGWSYPAAGERDARATEWSASVVPVRIRDEAWLVGWRERRLGLGEVASVISRAAVVGYRRRLSPLLWLALEAGGADVQYGDGTRERGPVAGVTLNAVDVEPGILTPRVHIWKDVATNVTAEVGHRLGSGRMTLRWEALADVQGRISRDPTFLRELSVGVQDTVARATLVAIEASYGRTRLLRIVAPQVEVVRASGWVARRIRPWLTTRAGGSYLGQSGVSSSSIPVLRRIRWEVAFAAHAP